MPPPSWTWIAWLRDGLRNTRSFEDQRHRPGASCRPDGCLPTRQSVTPRLWTPACPAATNPRPPQPKSRVLASARIAPRRPPAALDPGRDPRPEACQQPGRQDRAISMPYGASTRSS
jgi:hypothetical protein